MSGERFKAIEVGLLSRAIHEAAVTPEVVAGLSGYEFTDPALQWCFELLEEAWNGGGELLTRDAAEARMTLSPESTHVELIAALDLVYLVLPPVPVTFAVKTLLERVKHLKLTGGIDSAIKSIERGDLDGAQTVLAETATTTSSATHVRSHSLIEWDKWKPVPIRDGIKTGFTRLDEVQQGLRPGEMGIIFGTTGMGKSILGVNFGWHASRIQRVPVLHFDSENGYELVRARYLARLDGRHSSNAFLDGAFCDEDQIAVREWAEAIKEDIDKYLQIVPIGIGESTIADVRSEYQRMKRSGFIPRLIVLDSPDHLKFKTSDNAALDFARSYQAVRGWAESDNIPVWAVTQAGRDFEGKVSTTKAMAWSYDKARIASCAVSINPGKDPKTGKILPESQMDGQRSLYVAKARTSRSRFTIDVETDLDKALIKQEGEFERSTSHMKVVDAEESDA